MSNIEGFGIKKIFEHAEAEDNIESMNGRYDDAEADVKQSLIDSLDLNETEKEVLDNIDFTSDEAVKNSSGMVKVHGDCPSTTCTYTETYYSCPSTEP
jgi:hypothetical protein